MGYDRLMRRVIILLTALTAAVGIAVPATAANRHQPDRGLMPMVACVGTNIWLDYPTDTASCNATPPQQIHIRYIPSTWTLAQAHTYCTAHGSDGAYTRWGNTANVCPDIDY